MTPPIPPTPPDEPVNIWAPPAGPPPGYPAGPPSGYPSPFPPAAPARRTSRVGVTIMAVLGVLLLGALSVTFFLLLKDRGPGTAVGDCVKLTGVESNLKYDKVSCDGKLHNYTVVKVLSFQSDDCGDDPDAYTTYHSDKGFNGEHLCLVPVFFDGECYDFMLASLTAENPAVDCGATGAIKVRVLTNTTDEAACGPDSLKAMAYRETNTTYCFTAGS